MSNKVLTFLMCRDSYIILYNRHIAIKPIILKLRTYTTCSIVCLFSFFPNLLLLLLIFCVCVFGSCLHLALIYIIIHTHVYLRLQCPFNNSCIDTHTHVHLHVHILQTYLRLHYFLSFFSVFLGN